MSAGHGRPAQLAPGTTRGEAARPTNGGLATPPAGVVGQRDQGGGAEELGRAFKGAVAAMRRMRGRERHRPGQLSDAQFGLLFSLRDRDRMSASELALAADLRPATVTEMLDGLADHGLVQRARSDQDRRVVLTSLTEGGRALVEHRRARFEPRFRAAMSEFSEQELLLAAAVLDRLGGFFDQLAEERVEGGGAAGGDQPLE
jgi:DNA-binding MarR family transcriptional regulator